MMKVWIRETLRRLTHRHRHRRLPYQEKTCSFEDHKNTHYHISFIYSHYVIGFSSYIHSLSPRGSFTSRRIKLDVGRRDCSSSGSALSLRLTKRDCKMGGLPRDSDRLMELVKGMILHWGAFKSVMIALVYDLILIYYGYINQDVQKYSDDTYDRMIQHGNKTQCAETAWLYGCQTVINNTATRHLGQAPRLGVAPTMADNKKQEKDFTKEVDELLPQVDAIIKVRSLVFLSIRSYSICFSQASFRKDWIDYSCLKNKLEM